MAFRSALWMLALAPVAANEFLQRAAAAANLATTPQCESLSQTDPARCPKVKGGSGEYINADLTCVYDPQCARPGGHPAPGNMCFEQTSCAYRSTPATAPAPAPGGKGVGEECGNSGDCQDGLKCYKPPSDKVADFSGASKYCVQTCDKDNHCPSGTYCVCEVRWPIPLPPSSASKDVQFCSNPPPPTAVTFNQCFWPQVQPMPPPPITATTPALSPGGKGVGEEAALLKRAAAAANLATTPQCGGLSQTDPARCPKVKGGSGEYINMDLTCVYDPQCAKPGGHPAPGNRCFEQTNCAYRSTPAPR